MISFNPGMQIEKIAVIVLAVIIVVVLSITLLAINSEDILGNLFGKNGEH